MSRVPWLVLAGLCLGATLWVARQLGPVEALLPACAFKRVTGWACATCGLTRCLLALGRGQWAQAFHWHPVAASLVLLWPVAMVWDLRRSRRRDPYPALPDSRLARAVAWGLLAVVWALQVARGI
jgi:hypothetical protein